MNFSCTLQSQSPDSCLLGVPSTPQMSSEPAFNRALTPSNLGSVSHVGCVASTLSSCDLQPQGTP